MEFDGIFLVNKAAGITSRKVDDLLLKKFNIKKSGHLGTLDPFATGLLVIAINKGTKLLQFINDDVKTYEGSIKLGIFTDTYDIDGKILENNDVVDYSSDDLNNAINYILSLEEITPPIYSAIKVNGKKLLKYAKNNEFIDLEKHKRKVKIYSFEIKNISEDKSTINFSCKVSKGTYVRSLAILFAEKLNNIGCLETLCRTSVGDYELKNAKSVDEISENDLIPYNEVLKNYKTIKLDEKESIDIKNGKPLFIKNVDEERILLTDMDGNYLAIYQKVDENKFISLRGLF